MRWIWFLRFCVFGLLILAGCDGCQVVPFARAHAATPRVWVGHTPLYADAGNVRNGEISVTLFAEAETDPGVAVNQITIFYIIDGPERSHVCTAPTDNRCEFTLPAAQVPDQTIVGLLYRAVVTDAGGNEGRSATSYQMQIGRDPTSPLVPLRIPVNPGL